MPDLKVMASLSLYSLTGMRNAFMQRPRKTLRSLDPDIDQIENNKGVSMEQVAGQT